MSNKQLEEYLLEVVDRDGWTSGRQPRHVDMDNNCTSNSRIEHMLKTRLVVLLFMRFQL
jgi:hypothetical protein